MEMLSSTQLESTMNSEQQDYSYSTGQYRMKLRKKLNSNIVAADKLAAVAEETSFECLYPLAQRVRGGYKLLALELEHGMPEDIAASIMDGWVEWHNRIVRQLGIDVDSYEDIY